MFGRRKQNAQITTIIGKGCELKGGFTGVGGIRIDGVVRGDIVMTGDLVLGPEGKIFGDVLVSSAMIGGQVRGDLTAKDKVELVASARVYGDITTGRIVIDENAVFQGRCSTGPLEAQESPAEAAGSVELV